VRKTVSHSRDKETPEAKARWFQSLSLQERMDVFCELADLILAINPRMAEQRHVEPIPGRIQVLSGPRG